MKTTMNAELSSEEHFRVHSAWNTLTSIPTPLPTEQLTIPQMLAHATSLVEAAHELRRAIADACYYAERRAFPSKPEGKAARVIIGGWDIAKTIADLGITPAEIEELIRIKKGY
jgi:hypothetical protein